MKSKGSWLSVENYLEKQKRRNWGEKCSPTSLWDTAHKRNECIMDERIRTKIVGKEAKAPNCKKIKEIVREHDRLVPDGTR